ncbi:MAG: cell wall anchor protein [Microthrixaceae bacterium]
MTVGAVLATAALAAMASPTPVSADEPGSTSEALAWIDAELDASGGFLPGPGSTEPDWGLTADVALAHISTGDGTSERTKAIAATLLGALGSYSTWDDIGTEFPGVRLAGPLAKVLLVAASAGLDTSDVEEVDLADELAGLMQGAGDQAGRYSDRNEYGPDVSNGFGQAYAMLAVAVSGEVPPRSIEFLLAQQCPSGGFRLVYDETPGCVSDDDSDPDATALAVQVLLVLERSDAVSASLARVTGQLISLQAADGSFAGAPPVDVPNANSTGLVAQALRAAGRPSEAGQAASWVASQLQLGASAVGTPAEPDIGAVAYDPTRRTEALAGGVGSGRDQWRRATPQGLLAFDAGLIVDGVDEPPVEPVIPATTTSSTTTTSSSTTTTTAASDLGSSPPPETSAPPATQPPAPAATVGGTSTGAQLAATGTRGGNLTVGGASMVVLGAALIWLAVRTGPRREAWHWRP